MRKKKRWCPYCGKRLLARLWHFPLSRVAAMSSGVICEQLAVDDWCQVRYTEAASAYRLGGYNAVRVILGRSWQ